MSIVFEQAAGGLERKDVRESFAEDQVAGLEEELFGVVIEIGKDEVFDEARGVGGGAKGFENEEGVEGAIRSGEEANLAATVCLGGAVEVAIGDKKTDQRESEEQKA